MPAAARHIGCTYAPLRPWVYHTISDIVSIVNHHSVVLSHRPSRCQKNECRLLWVLKKNEIVLGCSLNVGRCMTGSSNSSMMNCPISGDPYIPIGIIQLRTPHIQLLSERFAPRRASLSSAELLPRLWSCLPCSALALRSASRWREDILESDNPSIHQALWGCRPKICPYYFHCLPIVSVLFPYCFLIGSLLFPFGSLLFQ